MSPRRPPGRPGGPPPPSCGFAKVDAFVRLWLSMSAGSYNGEVNHFLGQLATARFGVPGPARVGGTGKNIELASTRISRFIRLYPCWAFDGGQLMFAQTRFAVIGF